MNTRHRNVVVIVSLFVSAIMVLSCLSVFAGSELGLTQGTNTSNETASPLSLQAQQSSGNQVQASGSSPSYQGAALTSYQGTVTNVLKNYKGPMNSIFLPNLKQSAAVENGVVQPLYSRAPAPMGVGYLGTQLHNGQLYGTILHTSSFLGTISLNNISVANIANDGPDQFSIQLNTILAHTTLFGNSSYVFWTQNVILYTLSTHELSFEDNIWNFSSPTAVMSSNAIYSSTGMVYPYPGVHIAAGPTFIMPFPFSVDLYLNTTVINGRDAVFFNYSIPGTSLSGTYDGVIFNSTYGMNPGYSAPSAYFEVNGFQLTPLGLPYDAEIMLGGPGGGTGNSIYAVNGTMTLQYMQKEHGRFFGFSSPGRSHGYSPKAKYVNVPSAYNFGTDTGETSDGMTVSWSHGAVANLYAGPSLLYGMWNLSRTNFMETFKGTVSPSNAFMFVSQGYSFNLSSAEWTPLSGSGSYYFVLPFGAYTAEFLLSYYSPRIIHLTPSNLFGHHWSFGHFEVGSSHVSLDRNASMGIYTPLFAENNAQLASISISGHGTPASPYILDNKQYQPISPLFSEINDYNFPVFAGVMLYYTTANVVITEMPSLYMPYLDVFSPQLQYFGLPDFNYLGYWLYHTSGVSIINNENITGWFSLYSSGIPDGNILTWDSSNTLIAYNTLNVLDSGIVIFGGTDNTLFGNTLITNDSAYTPFELYAINVYGAPLGLSVYSSGNTIYNNNFQTYFTAYSPPYNPYNGYSVIWMNDWNVSLRAASSVSTVNGVALTGSITGGSYEGGNYWWNFYGSIPYDDNLLIYGGGDYLPLNGLMVVTNPSSGIPNNSGISPVPNPTVPDTTPVSIPLFSDFVVTHYGPTYTGTISIPSGQWASIVLVYNGSANGIVYDSSYSLVMDNVTVFTGTSPEYGNWSVQSNLTEYTSLLQGSVSFTFSPPMAIISGNFTNSMELLLYPVAPGATPPSEPNMVVPFSSSSSITIPTNVTGANLQLYVYGFSADEFWYADEPAYQPYRAINVSVDGAQIANVLPFPYINTGGIDNFMWRPVPAAFTLNDPAYYVNVTGALGLLEGTHSISIQVEGNSGYWTMSGAVLLYTNSSAGPAMQVDYSNFPGVPVTQVLTEPAGTLYFTGASSNYTYASYIPTSTGYELAIGSSYSVFENLQEFSADGVWQNITQLELTTNLYFTQYFMNGQYTNVTTIEELLFGLQMNTGAVFVTSNTTYPMEGSYTEYVQNLSQEWLQVTETEVQQGSNISLIGSELENAVFANGIFVGNLTLTSPYAGEITAVDLVASQVTAGYYYATFNETTLISSYTHIIEAQTNSATAPYYQASITEDNVWTLQDVSLISPP